MGAGDAERGRVRADLPTAPALFAVLHLFGHCAQWSSSVRAREFGRAQIADPTDDELHALVDYELEAHDIGLQLLHESLPDFGIRAPVPKRIPVLTPTHVGRRALGGRVIDFRRNP